MPKLTDGIAEAADGAGKLDDGAGKLAEGADQFAGGVGKYTTGVSQAATGSQDLAGGLDQLADGSEKYSDGVGEFSDGVQDGADEVPSYTAPERDTLSTVAAANIEAPDTDSVTNLLTGSTIALLIMLALWVGGLVTYTVLKPIPSSTLLSTQSSVLVWYARAGAGRRRRARPGARARDPRGHRHGHRRDPGLRHRGPHVRLRDRVHDPQLRARRVLGGVGRFLSVIAVVLAVAGRTIGAVPEFFTFIAPAAADPGDERVRAIAAGTPDWPRRTVGRFAWAVIGLVASAPRDRAGAHDEAGGRPRHGVGRSLPPARSIQPSVRSLQPPVRSIHSWHGFRVARDADSRRAWIESAGAISLFQQPTGFVGPGLR